MAFVNEDISDEDMIKYRIDEMAWGYKSNHFRSWVIDHEQDIYLREANFDRENTEHEFWSFYWKGYQWPVYGSWSGYEEKTQTRRAQYTVRLKFTKFPDSLMEKIDEIRSDFMEAYRAHSLRNDVETTFIFE